MQDTSGIGAFSSIALIADTSFQGPHLGLINGSGLTTEYPLKSGDQFGVELFGVRNASGLPATLQTLSVFVNQTFQGFVQLAPVPGIPDAVLTSTDAQGNVLILTNSTLRAVSLNGTRQTVGFPNARRHLLQVRLHPTPPC